MRGLIALAALLLAAGCGSVLATDIDPVNTNCQLATFLTAESRGHNTLLGSIVAGVYDYDSDGSDSAVYRDVYGSTFTCPLSQKEVDEEPALGDVWYRLRPDNDLMYEVSTCQNVKTGDADIPPTYVTLFRGEDCATLQCDDLSIVEGFLPDTTPYDCGEGKTETRVLFRAQRGTSYFLMVSPGKPPQNRRRDEGDMQRTFQLEVNRWACDQPPNVCSNCKRSGVCESNGCVAPYTFDGDASKCVVPIELVPPAFPPIEGDSFTFTVEPTLVPDGIKSDDVVTWFVRYEGDDKAIDLTSHPLTQGIAPVITLERRADGKCLMTIERAHSNWQKYFFSVRIDRAGGYQARSLETRVVLSRMRVYVGVLADDSVEPANTFETNKRIDVYWHKTFDYPAYSRYVFSTLGLAGTTPGKRYYFTSPNYDTMKNKAQTAPKFDLRANSVVEDTNQAISFDIGNQYYEFICDHIVMVFSPFAGSSFINPASARNDLIRSTLEASLKTLYPSTDPNKPTGFTVRLTVVASQSLVGQDKYEVHAYAREWATGLPVPAPKLVAALQWNGADNSIFTPKRTQLGDLSTGTSTYDAGTKTVTPESFCTVLTSETGYLATNSDKAIFAMFPTTTLEPGVRWRAVAADNQTALATPWERRIMLQSLSTYEADATKRWLTVKVGGTTDTPTFTFGLGAKADAVTFEITSQTSWFIVNGGKSKTIQFAAAKCSALRYGDVSRESDQNFANCRIDSNTNGYGNDPTYRRFEVDLGGEFSVSKVILTTMINLAWDDPTSGTRLTKLYARLTKDEPYVELTSALPVGNSNGCSPRSNQLGCLINQLLTYDVIGYVRTSLSPPRPGMLGFRYLRLVFENFPTKSSDVPQNLRCFSINRFAVIGFCPCNAHSEWCDYATGLCSRKSDDLTYSHLALTKESMQPYQAQAIGRDAINNCQHRTAGNKCDTCETGFYFAAAPNAPPTTPFITPQEIADGQYLYPTYGGEIVDVAGDPSTTMANMFEKFFGPVVCSAEDDAAGNCEQLGQWVCQDCDCRGLGYGEWKNSTGTTCDQNTGVCNCHPDTFTQGNTCETCLLGYCRPLCFDDFDGACLSAPCVACNCNGHSVTRLGDQDICTREGCGCTCDATHNVDVNDPYCASCAEGAYSSSGTALDGEKCTLCYCYTHKQDYSDNQDRDICYVVDGDCEKDRNGDKQDCTGNTFGSQCERCLPSFYRDGNDATEDKERDCSPCNHCQLDYGSKEVTFNVGGEDEYFFRVGMKAKCNPWGGACFCDETFNVEGRNCDVCKRGYYRTPEMAAKKEPCKKCECNGHKASVDNECNPATGDCNYNGHDCEDNTAGFDCSLCLPTWYREGDGPWPATDSCSGKCDCTGNGDVTQSGEDACDPNGGYCRCQKNTMGFAGSTRDCAECKDSYWASRDPNTKLTKGQTCESCLTHCYTHTTKCDKYTGSCSDCGDFTANGGENRCETCIAGRRRNKASAIMTSLLGGADIFTFDFNSPASRKETVRKVDCVPCSCNTHSTTCEENSGKCTNCGQNTDNGNLNTCEVCKDGFFRRSQTVESDVLACNVFTAYGTSLPLVTSSVVQQPCRPCRDSCFGTANDFSKCDKVTAECTCPPELNAEGHRCDRCKDGYFGRPDLGIPCRPCPCYGHTVSRNFGLMSPGTVGTLLQCQHKNNGALRGQCVLNPSALTPANIAAILANNALADTFAVCSCEASTSLAATVFADNSKYQGAQCTTCNPARYYGQPTTCIAGACTQYDTCKDCLCNENINLGANVQNCLAGLTQVCSNCLGNTANGPDNSCDVCATGYYGDARKRDGVTYANKCFKCDCNGQSTVRLKSGGSDIPFKEGDTCSPTVTDNTVAGQYTCTCKTGYVGPYCRECALTYKRSEIVNNGDTYVICTPCDSCTQDIYNLVIIPMLKRLALAESALMDDTAAITTYVGMDGSVLAAGLQVIQDAIDEATDVASQAADGVTAASNKLKTTENDLSGSYETLAGDIDSYFQSFGDRISDLNDQIGADRDRLGNLRNSVDDAGDDALPYIDDKITQANARVGDFNDEVSANGDMLTKALADLEDIRKGDSNLNLALTQLTDAVANIEGRLAMLNGDIADLSLDVGKARTQILDIDKNVLPALAASADAVSGQNDDLQDTLDGIGDAVADVLTTRLTTIQARMQGISDRIAALESVTPCGSNPCGKKLCRNVDRDHYECYCPVDKIELEDRCYTPVDLCATVGNPCSNGGTCLSSDTERACVCPPNFVGRHCEINIDPCVTAPCQNGGVCNTAGRTYECACTDGYTGTNCELQRALVIPRGQWVAYPKMKALTDFSLDVTFATTDTDGPLFVTYYDTEVKFTNPNVVPVAGDYASLLVGADGRLQFSGSPGLTYKVPGKTGQYTGNTVLGATDGPVVNDGRRYRAKLHIVANIVDYDVYEEGNAEPIYSRHGVDIKSGSSTIDSTGLMYFGMLVSKNPIVPDFLAGKKLAVNVYSATINSVNVNLRAPKAASVPAPAYDSPTPEGPIALEGEDGGLFNHETDTAVVGLPAMNLGNNFVLTASLSVTGTDLTGILFSGRGDVSRFVVDVVNKRTFRARWLTHFSTADDKGGLVRVDADYAHGDDVVVRLTGTPAEQDANAPLLAPGLKLTLAVKVGDKWVSAAGTSDGPFQSLEFGALVFGGVDFGVSGFVADDVPQPNSGPWFTVKSAEVSGVALRIAETPLNSVVLIHEH